MLYLGATVASTANWVAKVRATMAEAGAGGKVDVVVYRRRTEGAKERIMYLPSITW